MHDETAPRTETPAFLSRESILAKNDIEYSRVHVPQWGGYLRIRGLTGKERTALEKGMQKPVRRKGRIEYERDLKFFRERVVIYGTIDEQGQPLFTEKDLDALSTKSSAAVAILSEAIVKLSKMDDDDEEDLEKNSGRAPGSDS